MNTRKNGVNLRCSFVSLDCVNSGAVSGGENRNKGKGVICKPLPSTSRRNPRDSSREDPFRSLRVGVNADDKVMGVVCI